MAAQEVDIGDLSKLFSLEGKVAVVTGGSRGLGLSGASGLIQAGCRLVIISSRKAAACAEACQLLNALPKRSKGAEAIAIPADLSKTSGIQHLVDETKKLTDHVDILFANAGATWGARFEDHDEKAWDRVLDLNLRSVFFCVQKFLPLLRAQPPLGSTNPSFDDPARIITTASVAGLIVSPDRLHSTPSYAASKAALIHLTRHLAVDLNLTDSNDFSGSSGTGKDGAKAKLGPRKITSNALAPGFFPSRMANGVIDAMGGGEELAKGNPNGRLGRPADIAAATVYLAGIGGGHVNGGVVTLDGGKMWAKASL